MVSRSAIGVVTIRACVLTLAFVTLPALRAEHSQAPASPASALSDAEVEAFLKTARVVDTGRTKKGVTDSIRATLSNGTITHDAHVQNVSEFKREFSSRSGVEFNFRDHWSFNIAAYKLDRMLGLNMVPVSVERRYRNEPAAFTWWIEDVVMDEGERLKKNVQPPVPKVWNEQMSLVRLFDQLIYNVDRNGGNLLITRNWRAWAIDHTRAFRVLDNLKDPHNITRCDRLVFERLKALTRDALKKEMAGYLDDGQIRAILLRRDKIVELLEKAGETALFDRTAIGTN